MYKCPGCGAALRFDPKSQMMLCDHCRTTLSPRSEELTHLNQSLGQNAVGQIPGQDGKIQTIVYTCPNCGGTILSTEETAATFCSYCGSSVVLEGRLEEQEAPDVIIPFKMDKEDCKASYKRLLNRAVFTPNYMRKDTEIDKFRGIYMPYWIYSFYAQGNTSGSGSTTHREGNYVVTDHYRVDRYIDSSYDGLHYDAASNFSDVMSEAIAPFNAVRAEGFAPSYMSGFYADVSDVDKEVYEGDAGSIALDYMAGETAGTSTHTRCGVSASDVKDSIPLYSGTKRKGYFPVWFLANRIPGKNMVTYAVMNGETGKIAADLPVAFWKYILGALLLAIPIFLLLNLAITVTPTNALIATLVISAIMMIVLNVRINRTYSRQNGIDKGMMNRMSKIPKTPEELAAESSLEEEQKKVRQEEKKSRGKGCLMALLWIIGLIAAFILYAAFDEIDSSLGTLFIVVGVVGAVIIYSIVSAIRESAAKRSGTTAKAPMKKKIVYLIKPILGIIVSVLVLIIHPVSDAWYYGAAAFAELMVIWCAFDAVQLHNLGTTRPLPQFNKRGGVGNA
ncbi:MAG: TFIIB-type zinc ribbon-containing protein [Lachnospiraceae bacterium]|nr:TFIIB-type zinc ribbon-containing protein [Lachnospiraceae bacterium]